MTSTGKLIPNIGISYSQNSNISQSLHKHVQLKSWCVIHGRHILVVKY